MRVSPLYIVGGIVALLALVAFLPLMLSWVLDPWNMRVIRSKCRALGLSDIEIKPFPNHYGVHFVRNGVKQYAKCSVRLGRIRWRSNNPESHA